MEHDRGGKITLFIGGLSLDTSREDIELWVSKFSNNFVVDLVRSSQAKLSAFLHLDSRETANRILDGKNIIKGRLVDCQFAVDKGKKAAFQQDQKGKRIFVNNLPIGIGAPELSTALSAFGELRNLYLVKGKSNNRSLCYAEFMHRPHAKRATKHGIVLGKKKYFVFPYKSYNELSQQSPTTNKAAVRKPPTATSYSRSEKLPLSQTISTPPVILERSAEEFEAQLQAIHNINSEFHRYSRPCLHSYFTHENFERSHGGRNNPMYRFRLPADRSQLYRKIERHGFSYFLRLPTPVNLSTFHKAPLETFDRGNDGSAKAKAQFGEKSA